MGKSRSLVIATPLYPPQIGGPSFYAQNLGREFKKLGYQVRIVSFGEVLKYPTLARHIIYLFKLFKEGRGQGLIFSLDYFSVGFPALVVSKLLGIPLVLRLEGDFLWESFVERTRQDVTLSIFYQVLQNLSWKERLIKIVNKWVIYRASLVVFSSKWRQEMIIKAFNIPQNKTALIQNVWPLFFNPQFTTHNPQDHKIVLWAGRMLYLKNLHRLIRAFAKTNDGSYKLHLVGDGPERQNLEELVRKEEIKNVVFFAPLRHNELLIKLAQSSFLVLPSFSEVGPNIIADAVATQTPFIMTRYTGYAEDVKDFGLLIGPLDEKDIVSKIKMLMNEEMRGNIKKRLMSFPLHRNWQKAASDWIEVLNIFFRDQRSS